MPKETLDNYIIPLLNQNLDLILIIVLLIYLIIYIAFIIKLLINDNKKDHLTIKEKIFILVLFTYVPVIGLFVLLYINIYIINVTLLIVIPIIVVFYNMLDEEMTILDMLYIVIHLLIGIVPFALMLYCNQPYHNDCSLDKLNASNMHKWSLTIQGQHSSPDDRLYQMWLDKQEGLSRYSSKNIEFMQNFCYEIGVLPDYFHWLHYQTGDIEKLLNSFRDNQNYLDALAVRDPFLLSPTNRDSHLFLSDRQNAIQDFIRQSLPESPFNNRQDFSRLASIAHTFFTDLSLQFNLDEDTRVHLTNRYILEVLYYNLDNENSYQAIHTELQRLREMERDSNRTWYERCINKFNNNKVIISTGVIIIAFVAGITCGYATSIPTPTASPI